MISGRFFVKKYEGPAMERDILALINKEYHKFSKVQRMICLYIS